MRAILHGTVQPPAVVLLNAESRPYNSLWTETVGHGPRCSITVIDDGENPSTLAPKHKQVGSISGRAIHLQSPRVGDTFIEIGSGKPLGATGSWLGIQFKPLGRRPLAVEVGLVDDAGDKGSIRFESWRDEPSLNAGKMLIQLPLQLPPRENRVTEWAEFVVHLLPLLGLFRRLKSESEGDGEGKRRKLALPSQRLQSVSYVRVYANCRVRRVWLSNEGGVRDEWGLWAA